MGTILYEASSIRDDVKKNSGPEETLPGRFPIARDFYRRANDSRIITIYRLRCRASKKGDL